MADGLALRGIANMNFTYEVGMQVCSREEKGFKGTVVKIEDDNIQVQWAFYDKPDWCDNNEIMPDTVEAHAQMAELTKKVQAKVDEATVAFEAAFKAWRQANALQRSGKENVGNDAFEGGAWALRNNEDLDLSKFEEVVEANGWSTSSLYC